MVHTRALFEDRKCNNCSREYLIIGACPSLLICKLEPGSLLQMAEKFKSCGNVGPGLLGISWKTVMSRGGSCPGIDLFHNGGQINYSFVLMLISPTNLATTSKFQKNICFKTRAVGLININTKECKVGRHL